MVLQSSFLLILHWGFCQPVSIVSVLSSPGWSRERACLKLPVFYQSPAVLWELGSFCQCEAIASRPYGANVVSPILQLPFAYFQKRQPLSRRFSVSLELIWMFLSPPHTDSTPRWVKCGHQHPISFPLSLLSPLFSPPQTETFPQLSLFG